MKQKVYIKASASYDEIIDYQPSINRDIDRISCICIQTMKRLTVAAQVTDLDMPLFLGSAYGCLASLYEFNHIYEAEGALRVNPSLFPNTVLNAPACRVGITFQIQEPIYTISNGPSSGIDTLELAYLYIANGKIGKALVCLAEENSSIASKLAGHSILEGCFVFYLQAEYGDVEITEIGFSPETDKKTRIPHQYAGHDMELCAMIHRFVSEREDKYRCFAIDRKSIILERTRL